MVWANDVVANPIMPSPEEYGWEKEEDGFQMDSSYDLFAASTRSDNRVSEMWLQDPVCQ